jgi:hypothetical protein
MRLSFSHTDYFRIIERISPDRRLYRHAKEKRDRREEIVTSLFMAKGRAVQRLDPQVRVVTLLKPRCRCLGVGDINDQGKNNDEPMRSSGRWCEKRKYWTKEELEKRAGVSTAWLEVVNAGCHRQVLMKHFREDEVDSHTKEDSLHRCCNGSACEEKMTTYDSWPLRKQSSVVGDSRKPRSGTVAAIALERIEKWCLERADDLVGPEFMGEAPAWLKGRSKYFDGALPWLPFPRRNQP